MQVLLHLLTAGVGTFATSQERGSTSAFGQTGHRADIAE
jgi:hypothetical protein